MRQLHIGEKVVDDDSPCYVIAEIGHNHQGDVETAKKMIASAAAAGVDAVKIQKRDNRSLFTQEFYDAPYNSENSFGPTYGAHREALELDREAYVELQAFSRQLGVDFFATAFDIPSADFLVDLGVPAIKIASGDVTNTPLLQHVASLGVAVIVSTGGATMEDVERAHDVLSASTGQVAILQCTAGYPPEWGELNLRVIGTFRERFPDVVIGLSSHDSGIAMALTGYLLGARIIEKHFTLNRAMKGTDHAFSLEPTGMTKLVRDLHRARVALGDGKKTVYDSEIAPIRKMSKALVAARPLPAGHRLGPEDIVAKSPGDGLPPYHVDDLLGRILARPVEEDQPFALDLLDHS